ncbi:hypothetical protein E2986_12349 [Frieseomelitta varia]|uniref:Elongation of very long chain fatty acids protein n=1 Tax=Frieseomelitta varia TaxID=561572 RepID=A0A833S6T5_9HYME|nr:elongation of very long chain fatty acids protein 6-like [Frieseomelitta varia]XP_043514181.1 elongation of very long chain fatty acids protein 6-like [Frieseomelitta varia]KAF3425750.1 hypothetical protein E2986_12349 [Frieseomelitta varia]
MNVQLHPMDRVQVTLPNYSYVLNFEKNFVYSESQTWMRDHFPNCFYYSAIYALLIFGGRRYMSDRPKFELRGLLALWSTLLAILSIFCFSRILPEMYHVLTNHGYYYSVCVPRYLTHNPVSSFSLWIFTTMKLIEFGDTVFIVLRKQPLIFLHWYHHITVLLYAWFSYVETTGSGIWFSLINTFIHSIMYSYYALKAMRFRVPKSISIILTTLQIIQMFWGIVITTSAYYYIYIAQIQCNITPTNLIFSMLMYCSYLILFVNFFKQSYLSNKRVNKEKKNETKTQ